MENQGQGPENRCDCDQPHQYFVVHVDIPGVHRYTARFATHEDVTDEELRDHTMKVWVGEVFKKEGVAALMLFAEASTRGAKLCIHRFGEDHQAAMDCYYLLSEDETYAEHASEKARQMKELAAELGVHALLDGPETVQ